MYDMARQLSRKYDVRTQPLEATELAALQLAARELGNEEIAHGLEGGALVICVMYGRPAASSYLRAAWRMVRPLYRAYRKAQNRKDSAAMSAARTDFAAMLREVMP